MRDGWHCFECLDRKNAPAKPKQLVIIRYVDPAQKHDLRVQADDFEARNPEFAMFVLPEGIRVEIPSGEKLLAEIVQPPVGEQVIGCNADYAEIQRCRRCGRSGLFGFLKAGTGLCAECDKKWYGQSSL